MNIALPLLYRETYALFDKEQVQKTLLSKGICRSDDRFLISDESSAPCIAKIDLKIGFSNLIDDWEAQAVAETLAPPAWFNTSPNDLRYAKGNRSAFFYGSRWCSEAPYVMRVSDFTTPSQLRGLGIASWVLGQFLRLCTPLTGPDPWLTGDLSQVDADNPSRDPFWRRHVDDDFQTDSNSEGRFLGPWMHSYNRHKSSVVAVKMDAEGYSPPMRVGDGKVYEVKGGKLAFKFN